MLLIRWNFCRLAEATNFSVFTIILTSHGIDLYHLKTKTFDPRKVWISKLNVRILEIPKMQLLEFSKTLQNLRNS